MQVRVLSVCTAVLWRGLFVLLWPVKGGVDAALGELPTSASQRSISYIWLASKVLLLMPLDHNQIMLVPLATAQQNCFVAPQILLGCTR